MRHQLGDGMGVEGTRTHKSGGPQAAELGQLLVQRHEGEQVLDPLLNGGVRVAIECCGHMCTPCYLFLLPKSSITGYFSFLVLPGHQIMYDSKSPERRPSLHHSGRG